MKWIAKALILILIILAAASIILISVNKNTSSTTKSSTTNYGGKILGVAGAYLNQTSIGVPKQYGIKWMRFDINFQPRSISYIRNLSEYNYSVLGILDYQSMCGTKPGSPINCTWNLTDWNGTVSNAVAEFPNVHAWEIYNEPQLPVFYSGFYNGSTYNYYLMLKSAYSIIKRHNSSDTVLCLGGDNLYYNGAGPSLQDYQWAESVWGYGASQYCDAISIHIYSNMQPIGAVPYGSSQTMAQIFNYSLGEYENLTGKPVWITEVGIPSNNGTLPQGVLNNSLDSQNKFLNQSFSLLLSKPYVKAVFWFNLKGTVNAQYHFDYGLFNQNMTPKPALFAYQRFVDKYSQ